MDWIPLRYDDFVLFWVTPKRWTCSYVYYRSIKVLFEFKVLSLITARHVRLGNNCFRLPPLGSLAFRWEILLARSPGQGWATDLVNVAVRSVFFSTIHNENLKEIWRCITNGISAWGTGLIRQTFDENIGRLEGSMDSIWGAPGIRL